MNKPTFKHICLMHIQQLTNFPYIEKDFDALTDYGLLCKIVDYLNQVITNENTQNENILALYNAFTELKDYVDNYFDNLDVQDEINNKLDEMVEDGILEQIIEQYLNSTAIWGFNTVADMKNATNLINGSYAETLGYYSKNDGGGALYKIREIKNTDNVDEGSIVSLENEDLIAELVVKDSINTEQFGAHGDNTNDDTLFIQNAINYAINHNKKLIARGTYLINSSLIISGNYLSIDFSDSEINYTGNESAIIITKCTDSNIEIGKIISNTANSNGIEIKSDGPNNWCQYLNIRFQLINVKSKCIYFNRTSGWLNEIRITNGKLDGGDYGIYTTQGSSSINNISIINVGVEGVNTGFYLNNIESWNFLNCRYHESFETLFETIGVNTHCNFIGTGLFYPSKNNFSNGTNNWKIIAPIAETGGALNGLSGTIQNGLVNIDNYNNIINLNNRPNFDTRTEVESKMQYTSFLVGSNTISLKLDSRYGRNNGINEFYVNFNFDNNTPFSIYKNDTLIFNNTSNVGWKWYRFYFNGYEWLYGPVTLNNNLITS